MTIRVGESWTARNGHRRWVSLPLHDVLALGLLGAPFFLLLLAVWWMILAELWLAAESVLLLVTASWLPVRLAAGGAGFGDVTLTRLRWGLWMADVR